MLFLNAALLTGLLGIGIPVLLHLFSRKSARIVDWGAMRFLLDSLAKRTRRIQLEDALLMAARCLLFGCLALAVARPFAPPGSAIPYGVVLPALLVAVTLFGCAFAVWSNRKVRFWFLGLSLLLFGLCGAAILFENQLQLRRLTGAGQQDIALVIDGSTSMTLNLGGGTLFDRAIEEAREIVLKSSDESAFAVILAGPAPVVMNATPRANAGEIDKILTALEPLDGEARLLEAVGEAARVLEGGTRDSKQIVVFSDGQALGWESGNTGAWERARKALESLPHKPQLALRRFPPPPQIRNLAITGLAFAREVIGIDREVEIALTLANTGTEAVTPSAIQLQIGGQTLDADTISQFSPGMVETLRFQHHFTTPGAHVVTASVRVDDDIQLDNTFSTALTVVGQLKVLVVDGNPAARYFDRASAFIETALAPGMTAGSAYLVEPVVLDAPQIVDVSDFDQYRAVILADVPRLPAKTAEQLAAYVGNGGGLLVAPGQRADPKFYNAWNATQGTPLLPAQLAEARVVPTDRNPVGPALGTFDHPSLHKVGDSTQSDFAGLVLASYWKMSARKDGRVVAKLNTGEPFAVIGGTGSGTVVQLACALAARSSNLATRRSFLPFVHELVYFLANPEGFQLNLAATGDIQVMLKRETGTSDSSDNSNLSGPSDPADPAEIYPVVDPTGAERAARIIASRQTLVAEVPGVPTAGLYEIRVPSRARPALESVSTPAGTIPFTVIRPAGESDFVALTDQDFAFIGRYADILKPESSGDVLTILAGKSFGEELWKYMALGALFLLVAEVGLTRWIATARKSGEDETVHFESAKSRTQRQIQSLRKAS